MAPFIYENNGKKLLVLAFTDLDGTVNDQGVKEKYRLSTIAPAVKAIETLQSYNIPVGIITARSFGETQIYQRALNTNGYTITEDGTVIILPPHVSDDELLSLSSNKRIVNHHNQQVMIMSSVDIDKIIEFIQFIKRKLIERNLSSELITTATSTAETLQAVVHYESISDAQLAKDRLASAFIRNATEEQYTLIKEYAPEWGLRISGKQHHIHVLGCDANKGSSLHFITTHLKHFNVGNETVDGVYPIVFGNDYNDLALFQASEVLGGISVLVNDSSGNYRLAEEDIPSYVMRMHGAHGYGIQESIETIIKRLRLNS
jgi:HAD superfamily hydrolase (TIGR01484 family)